MPKKITLSLNDSNYSLYDDSTPIEVALTDKQKAVILSAFLLLFYRNAWDDMTDAEWEIWEGYLAAISAQIE